MPSTHIRCNTTAILQASATVARLLPSRCATFVAHAFSPDHFLTRCSVLANRPHPEHGFRTCLGVLRLFRDLRPAQAEAVSARALEIGAFAYGAVAAIATRQSAAAARTATEPAAIVEHSNLRGPGYFH